MKLTTQKPWSKGQRINYYLNWFVILLFYFAMFLEAMQGKPPNTKYLGGMLIFNAFMYGYIWKLSGKNKWVGAGVGLLIALLVQILCGVVARVGVL